VPTARRHTIAMAALAGPADEAVWGAAGQDSLLLTTSCTTGWADWVHGELWLCPDGLLRVSLGLAATIAKSSGPGQAAAFEGAARQSSPRHFDMTEINELLSRKRTNIWIPWPQIRGASLRHGLITGRLRLIQADGRCVKFLWMRERRVFEMLRDRLLDRLGPAAVRIG
jgi:hypothetical protein